MTAFASAPGRAPDYLVKGFNWASLGPATVVDIGGSEGTHDIALAKAYPELNFIVQDLPAVVKAVKNKERPADVKDRISFMEHDMFQPQNVSADIYLFRWIFHDWPDKYVIEILRQLVPAMKKGARVIINEYILPEPGTSAIMEERRIR